MHTRSFKKFSRKKAKVFVESRIENDCYMSPCSNSFLLHKAFIVKYVKKTTKKTWPHLSVRKGEKLSPSPKPAQRHLFFQYNIHCCVGVHLPVHLHASLLV